MTRRKTFTYIVFEFIITLRGIVKGENNFEVCFFFKIMNSETFISFFLSLFFLLFFLLVTLTYVYIRNLFTPTSYVFTSLLFLHSTIYNTSVSLCLGVPIVDFYPFGTSDDLRLSSIADASTDDQTVEITLTTPFVFYGRTYTQIYVSLPCIYVHSPRKGLFE